jgi:hypothetical protein
VAHAASLRVLHGDRRADILVPSRQEADMDTIAFIRQQLRQTREFLEGTLTDVDDKMLHAQSPGVCNTIGATYAHVVQGEDGFVNGLIRGQQPLFAGAWAGKTGMSEPPPDGPDWSAWSSRVRIDLPALRAYAKAVADGTDLYVASLTSADLDRVLDLSGFGLGEQTLGWVLGAAVLGHIQAHWGEISALKGMQGGKGFPF